MGIQNEQLGIYFRRNNELTLTSLCRQWIHQKIIINVPEYCMYSRVYKCTSGVGVGLFQYEDYQYDLCPSYPQRHNGISCAGSIDPGTHFSIKIQSCQHRIPIVDCQSFQILYKGYHPYALEDDMFFSSWSRNIWICYFALAGQV